MPIPTNYVSGGASRAAGNALTGGLNARGHGINMLGRAQELEMMGSDRDRAKRMALADMLGRYFHEKEQYDLYRKSLEPKNFWESGGGGAVGGLVGAGIGALIPGGGVAGAMLGSAIGGAAGGIGDAAAGGSPMPAMNLPSSLANYANYQETSANSASRRGLLDAQTRGVDAETKALLDQNRKWDDVYRQFESFQW